MYYNEMMKYVALLRGINVGGNNKVDMKQLKAALEANGFNDVSTYINSGNIFFTDPAQPIPALTRKFEQVIKATFGLDIKALILNEPMVGAIVRAIPKNWTNDTTTRTDVMFLWEEANNKNVLEQLTIKPDIDRVMYVPGAIIWSIDRPLVTRSGMLKMINTDLYKHMTIRNSNTARKLRERMETE